MMEHIPKHLFLNGQIYIGLQQSVCEKGGTVTTSQMYLRNLGNVSKGILWLGWWFQIFLIFNPTWEVIQFDVHIFQLGW